MSAQMQDPDGIWSLGVKFPKNGPVLFDYWIRYNESFPCPPPLRQMKYKYLAVFLFDNVDEQGIVDAISTRSVFYDN